MKIVTTFDDHAQPGLYDVKFRDKLHRECVLKNIDLKNNSVISIEEKKLVGHCRLLSPAAEKDAAHGSTGSP